MNPANDPHIDYKNLVMRGYDQCAEAYSRARRDALFPHIKKLRGYLSDGSKVLDIGCGAGIPITRALAMHYDVIGVDISLEMIKRAQVNVPEVEFIHADIMTQTFPASSFDGIAAFYSIFHLPREEHGELFRRIHQWLRPGGCLLATVTKERGEPYTEDDFFGTTMYWSNYGLVEYQEIVEDLSFTVLEISIIGHGYADDQCCPDEHHPLLFAQKASMNISTE